MRIGNKELRELRDELQKLTDFIWKWERKNLPYFYSCFDAMKNNIDIYLYVGNNDRDDMAYLFAVLERDWKKSHNILLGVQEYDPHKSHPDADPMLCIYFARLISNIGRYFERSAEFYVDFADTV